MNFQDFASFQITIPPEILSQKLRQIAVGYLFTQVSSQIQMVVLDFLNVALFNATSL